MLFFPQCYNQYVIQDLRLCAGKLAPSEKKLANSLDSAWKDITPDHLDVSTPYAMYHRRIQM